MTYPSEEKENGGLGVGERKKERSNMTSLSEEKENRELGGRERKESIVSYGETQRNHHISLFG